MGVKQQFTTACQYKLAYDTSDMDYLEFYIDRRFSSDYSWIFPKDGVINVGTGGNFAKLDAFLTHKGLSNHKVIEKEGRFYQRKITLRLISSRPAIRIFVFSLSLFFLARILREIKNQATSLRSKLK